MQAETIVAGDEDALVIPAEWLPVLHPRRGDAQVPAIAGPAHTGATAALEALAAQVAETGAAVIDNPRNEPELAEALRGQLAGRTTATGAAALALVAKTTAGSELAAHLDAWITARGLPFAVGAALEAVRISVADQYHRTDPFLVVSKDAGLRRGRQSLFRQLRSYLAAAGEAEYAQVVQLAESRQRDLSERVLLAYLLPTERAWVAQTCTTLGKIKALTGQWRPWIPLLQCSLTTVEELESLRKRRGFQVDYTDLGLVATLAIALGPASAPLFPAVLDNTWADAAVRRSVLEVLARLPYDETFAVLAARLTAKHVPTAAAEAAERFPRRALRLLAAAACGEIAGIRDPQGNEQAARDLLAGQVVRHADLVAGVRPELSKAQRAVVDELAARIAGRPTAPIESLPELLVNPPWERKRPRARTRTEVASQPSPPADFCRIDWFPGEREEFNRGMPEAFDADWRPILDNIDNRKLGRPDGQVRGALLHAPEPEARQALASLRAEFGQMDQLYAFGPLLVRFGTDAITPILHQGDNRNLIHRAAVLQPIVDLRVARLMAQWSQRPGTGRAVAHAWLARHRDDAAVLLIPDAVGPDKKLRPFAEAALRHLAGPALGVEVAAIAERVYGRQVAAEVRAIVEVDPLELIPARAPKLPDWLGQAHLPQILLRDRRTALPEQSARHVITMLALGSPGEPYAGLATVRELTDPTSLAAFGRALFAAWRASDYPPKESWILAAQGQIGDAETLRRLVPLILSWPRYGGYQRAVSALEVLTDLGTDEAWFQLHRIALATAGRPLAERAEEKLAHLAAARGQTPDEFLDRLIPGLGLDQHAAIWLTYGPRRFHAAFDEHGHPTITDAQGATYPNLPDPAPADDPELAEAARARLSSLTEAVPAVRAHAARRLESAMTMRRGWSVPEFRALLAHPFVAPLASRLVWQSEVPAADGVPVTTDFRVAEDGGFADVTDAVFHLPAHATVHVAHPAGLGAATESAAGSGGAAAGVSAWAELFADYEILEPFPQLGRPIHLLTPAEQAGAPVTRFEGTLVPAAKLTALLGNGWQPQRPRQYAHTQYFFRPTLDNRWLALAHSRDRNYQGSDETPYSLGPVRVQAAPHFDFAGLDTQPLPALPLHDLDPITVSELLGDLSRLADGEL